jgi:ribonuclease HI
MKGAESAAKEIQVFLDGSVIEGNVGPWAVLTRKGRPNRTLHYHLEPDTEHTAHEAELTGILLGMDLLRIEKGGVPAAIGVDDQAAIRAFDSELRSPGHHLARETLRLAN